MTTEPKRKTIHATDFVNAYLAEVEANGSCTSLGEKLGLEPGSVYQRANKLSNQLIEAGQPELPKLPMKTGERKARSKRLDLAAIGNIVRAKQALDKVDEPVTTEVETKSE